MAVPGKHSLLAGAFLVFTCAVHLARAAAEAPVDPCSLLPSTAVGKILGQACGPPKKSVAPRPYANTVAGTDCRDEPSGNAGTLLFRVYFDQSPAEAAGLFTKLKMFYSPSTPVSGVGDEAYSDKREALHARKGNVRFYLELGGMDTAASAKEKQLKDLAMLVAAQVE